MAESGRKASPEEQPKAAKEMTAQSEVYGNSPPDCRGQTTTPGTWRSLTEPCPHFEAIGQVNLGALRLF